MSDEMKLNCMKPNYTDDFQAPFSTSFIRALKTDRAIRPVLLQNKIQYPRVERCTYSGRFYRRRQNPPGAWDAIMIKIRSLREFFFITLVIIAIIVPIQSMSVSPFCRHYVVLLLVAITYLERWSAIFVRSLRAWSELSEAEEQSAVGFSRALTY